ncbi:hypothetical protein U8016_001139 [Vibrio parahaemolyticus]|nr:hypothetical protein [Vibrio parahaemolyticus]EMB2739742.1 hypothetical protein [Vibrio parahaemolyticus]
MARSKKIGTLMQKLLIEEEMDGFTVVELRNASISIDSSFVDLDDARKKVYRQILRFMSNNWLRSEGKGQKKRYFQTDVFKNLQSSSKLKRTNISTPSAPDYSVLSHERNQFQGELEIVLGEIEGYLSLYNRFPELESKLAPFLIQARERSAHLLGQINVLTNALKIVYEGNKTC